MSDFNSLTRAQKRDTILSEDHSDGQPQVSMAPDDIDNLLAALSKTPKHKLNESYSTSASLALIADNWGVDTSSFPLPHHGRDFRPAGDVSAWDTRLLAQLAILSEFTPGQGALMGTHLCYAVELRNKKDEMWVKEADVKRVIKDILQPLRDPETGAPDAVRKRKTKYDSRKKKAKGADDAMVEDELDDIIVGGAQKAMEGATMNDDEEDE